MLQVFTKLLSACRMIETHLDIKTSSGHIIVCPNMSNDWQTTKLFLWLIAAVSFMISSFFAVLGAWMIFPFAGLEVLALVASMYWVAHQCRRQQVIHIMDDQVQVEKGILLPNLTWKSERFWTKLIVYRSAIPSYPNRLVLRGRKEQLEIGEFLNEEDKEKLVKALRKVINVVQ